MHYLIFFLFSEEECFLDKTTKAVPIVVGLSILGLLVIVFVTFLISRKKPHRGYERIWGALVLPKKGNHMSFCFYLAALLLWSCIFKWNDTMCLKLMHVSGSSFCKVGRKWFIPFIFRLFLATYLDGVQRIKVRSLNSLYHQKRGNSDHLSQMLKNSLKQAASLSLSSLSPIKTVWFF